ncbi:MAG: hypothetical protein E6I26_03590 [Chloroflexi bacterium]|nr:MAG: hypothetical protein E6I26_03590 [Chloroflexota bacterium]
MDQRPEVVHDRLLELGARLRDELPPIQPGTQAATLLGVSGTLGVEVADRGPRRIDVRTTRGRIRGEGAVDIKPTADDRTTVSMVAIVKPTGFGASLMLGAALASMPRLQRQIVDGLERGFDDLAAALAKPDDQWDAATWTPPGVPAAD